MLARWRAAFALIFICTQLPLPALADLNDWSLIGLRGLAVFDLAVDPTDTSVVYAGTDAGVFRSADRGLSWTLASDGLTNRGVRTVAIDPATTNVIYAGTGAGIFKSQDSAATWSVTGLTTPAVEDFVIDPADTDVVYAATNQRVFKTNDGGAAWAAANTGLTSSLTRALIIDPVDPQILFVATEQGVFRSKDAAASWEAVNTGLTDPSVTALALDPMNPSTVYAGTNTVGGGVTPGVFQSSDGGATWAATGLAGAPIRELAVDPLDSMKIYAGTSQGGIFRTLDGAVSWGVFNAGLGNTQISALANDQMMSDVVYSGTADGLYQIGIATPPIPEADLGVSVEDDADPIVATEGVTYTITVTNAGPETAEGVLLESMLVDQSGALLGVFSFTTTQGRCFTNGLTCLLDSIASGASATVTLDVVTDVSGLDLQLTAEVVAATLDPRPSNNADAETTTVDPIRFELAPRPDDGGLFAIDLWVLLVLLSWFVLRVANSRR